MRKILTLVGVCSLLLLSGCSTPRQKYLDTYNNNLVLQQQNDALTERVDQLTIDKELLTNKLYELGEVIQKIRN